MGVIKKNGGQVTTTEPYESTAIDFLRKGKGTLKLKEKYGKGQVRKVPVKPGICYFTYALAFGQETCILPESWDSGQTIWFDVCLGGQALFHYKNRSVRISRGCSEVLVNGYDKCLKLEIKNKTPIQMVSIVLDPEALAALTGKTPGQLFSLSRPTNSTGPTSWAMMMAAEQLAAQDFFGVEPSLFTEAKVLELISYHLGRYVCAVEKTHAWTGANQDREKIQYAAELMTREMLNPPGIFDLADLAGLNHNKLIRGFKEVFEMTPFEFLSKVRLKKAASLIMEHNHSVTEAAFSVGYSNLSHFAKIFKREFGIPPSRFPSDRRLDTEAEKICL